LLKNAPRSVDTPKIDSDHLTIENKPSEKWYVILFQNLCW
jgi:hypothetical protein